MTNQQIYDRMADLMILQGRASIGFVTAGAGRSGMRCLYNSAEGDQCAVGCLFKAGVIPRLANPHPAGSTTLQAHLKNLLGRQPDTGFLEAMQVCHNSSPRDQGSVAWIISFLSEAINTGKNYKLDTSFAEEALKEAPAWQ